MTCPVCGEVPLTRDHLAHAHPTIFKAASSPVSDRSYGTCRCGIRLTSHLVTRCSQCRRHSETPGELPQLRLPRGTRR